MSRYDRYRRLAALAACVGSTTAMAALAAAGPATAVTCRESGLYASGSSFQNTAQGVFKKGWPTHSKCAVAPKETTITYTATASGEGLEVFGAGNAAGKFNGELLNWKDTLAKKEEEGGKCAPLILKAAVAGNGKCEDIFVGTDIAPRKVEAEGEASLEAMTKGAEGKSYNKAGGNGQKNFAAVVIPVAQGPVASMISLPAGCKILAGGKFYMDNAELANAYAAKVPANGAYGANTWGALLKNLGYTEVAKESELGENKFFQGPQPEETLQRNDGTEETVTVRTKAQVENNEAGTPTKIKSHKVAVKGEAKPCEQVIIPQVRSSESGTSYAYKGYLNQIDTATWKAFFTDKSTWPNEAAVSKEVNNTSGNGKTLNKKGSNLAENASSTPGSLGYADSADAAKGGGDLGTAVESQKGNDKLEELVETEKVENKTTKALEGVFAVQSVAAKSLKHQILYAQLQNTGTAKPTKNSEYTAPLIGAETKTPNCELNVLIAGDKNYPLHWQESWNGILASDPDAVASGASATDYSLCALTYDIAWHHYANPALYGTKVSSPTAAAEEMANTAKDFFEYVTGSTGITELETNGYYTGPPKPMRSHIAVAVKNIGV